MDRIKNSIREIPRQIAIALAVGLPLMGNPDPASAQIQTSQDGLWQSASIEKKRAMIETMVHEGIRDVFTQASLMRHKDYKKAEQRERFSYSAKIPFEAGNTAIQIHITFDAEVSENKHPPYSGRVSVEAQTQQTPKKKYEYDFDRHTMMENSSAKSSIEAEAESANGMKSLLDMLVGHMRSERIRR